MPETHPTNGDSARRDTMVVTAITLVCTWLAAHFDFHEALFEQTRRWEHLQLDELPIALFVLALCLVWLSVRRHRQTLLQLHARQAAEARLAAALAENRQLAQQHIRIQESERKHLARELHDELGQYLNAIKLDAVAIRETPADDAGTQAKAALDIIDSVDHVHGVVSDMIRRLRPAGLDELGLVAAVENCVDQWRQRLPKAHFSLSVSGNFDNLGESLNLTLYRLIQEGLTNCYKHAGARHIGIVLERDGAAADELVLRMRDDGQGVESGSPSAGFGLSGMRERVEMMGGSFSIDSSAGRGFGFEARLPSDGYE